MKATSGRKRPGESLYDLLTLELELGFDSDECILWQYTVDRDGYGKIRDPYLGYQDVVHRVVWRYLHGTIPPKYEIDHKCKIRSCYHPNHLQCIPQEDNKATGPRKVYCVNGHERTPENLYRGGCKECRYIRQQTPEHKEYMRKYRAEHAT